MIEKNVEIMADDIALGEMAAVKHANGIDWWIVTPKRNSNTWYKFLFSKDGIVDTLEQTIGTLPRPQAEGGIQICFSPDGSKLYRTNPQEAIKVYDFDRVAGAFTGFDTISVDYSSSIPFVVIENFCAVSPNGRFLYVANTLYIYQFDLYADDISTSQKIVAEWDGFQEPTGITFGRLQLGPDCKIYISSVDSKYYHVIHHPDEEGLACDVEQRGVVFPARTGGSMPSFPNYRLGPIGNLGLPCSPVVATQGPVPTLLPAVSVFPNPATDYLKIILNQPLTAPAEWRLYDTQGRLVREAMLRAATDRMEIAIQGLVSGVYFWQVESEGRLVGVGKLVIGDNNGS